MHRQPMMQHKPRYKASEASLQNARIELGYTRVYCSFRWSHRYLQCSRRRLCKSRRSNSVLTTISSIGGVRVRFQISEREYLRIAQMTKEELSSARKNVQLILADGSLYPQKGEVNFADREIDPKTGTLTIEATFPNPKGLLASRIVCQDACTIEHISQCRAGATTFRISIAKSGTSIYGNRFQTLKVTIVETGPKVGDAWIITKGLKAGR